MEVVQVARSPAVAREERRRGSGLDGHAPEGDVALEEVRAARPEDGKPVPLQRLAEDSEFTRMALFSPLKDPGMARGWCRAPLPQAGGGGGRSRWQVERLVLPGALHGQGQESDDENPSNANRSGCGGEKHEQPRPEEAPSAPRTRARRPCGRGRFGAPRAGSTRPEEEGRAARGASFGRGSASRRARANRPHRSPARGRRFGPVGDPVRERPPRRSRIRRGLRTGYHLHAAVEPGALKKPDVLRDTRGRGGQEDRPGSGRADAEEQERDAKTGHAMIPPPQDQEARIPPNARAVASAMGRSRHSASA